MRGGKRDSLLNLAGMLQGPERNPQRSEEPADEDHSSEGPEALTPNTLGDLVRGDTRGNRIRKSAQDLFCPQSLDGVD
jgi:hypothetical protein